MWPRLLLNHFTPGLSERGLDLLEKLLVYSPSKRISAKKALEHPFFEGFVDRCVASHTCCYSMCVLYVEHLVCASVGAAAVVALWLVKRVHVHVRVSLTRVYMQHCASVRTCSVQHTCGASISLQ
jgi:hypothetical protein